MFQSISKYVELFPKLLSLASENRPVLIVIDGFDQVSPMLAQQLLLTREFRLFSRYGILIF